MALPEAIYRAAFDQPPAPLAVVDGRGLLAIWNEAFERLFHILAGTGPERMRSSFFDFIAERGGQRFDFYAAEILLGGKDSASIETGVSAADGTRRWMRFSLSRIETKAPQAAEGGLGLERYILCQIEDVTDRVTRELRLTEAKAEAEKATQTKSLFLANMSHEIRTPIQTILGVVELLQETALDTEQAEYASQVRFSADVLLGLINDILDFSKIEAGRLELETTDFDLRACVSQSVDLLVMEAHRKGLEVIVDLDESLPTLVKGDPARVRQIIVNLFKNAVKFTKDGGISLVVRRARSASGSMLRMEVADTGIGVPEEVRTRLFTPFYQADFAAARKAGGTGLGLAISRNLVGLMGGTIGVSPGESSGSVFWFEIPLVSPPDSCAPRRAKVQGGPRLLVVDDHPGSRAFAVRFARSAGYLAAEAASGEEALAALRDAARLQEPYELCLIDQNMPHMDGWRLASEITGDTLINGARLVLMVPAGTMGADAKMKLLRWFNAYVSKPLKPDGVIEVLGRAFSADVDLEAAEAGSQAKEEKPASSRSFTANVLLAEDHEINRELFTLILSRLGCRTTTARDGVEAVELGSAAVESGSLYDIVLMDIFMPRMNGYEASKALREKGYRGPIVAVTASALKGEREKCVEAGMDDILLKPFQKADLTAVLERWLTVGAGGTRGMEAEAFGDGGLIPLDRGGGDQPTAELVSAAAVPESRQSAESGAEDPTVFDWDGVLDTFLGQQATVVSLLGRFIDKSTSQLGELREASESHDFTRFREVAHSIKGAAWNLSARRLGDAALMAEMAGKDGDAEGAAKSLVEVSASLEAFRKAAVRHM